MSISFRSILVERLGDLKVFATHLIGQALP